MKPAMLAASVRPIADVLVDSLRASGRLSRLRATLPDEDDHAYQQHQFSLELEDECDEKEVRSAPQILHPDEAAAAVLLGKAFERSRDVLAILRQPDTVAIITVPHADFVEPINKVLRKHVLGPETSVIDGDSLSKRTTLASPDAVVIFESPGSATSRKTRPGGAEFAAAVQLRCAIIAITPDLGLLPHELVSLAEHRVVVPPLDGAAIDTVIEAVTGRRPFTQIDEKLASRVPLESLSIAVRADLGPERSSARLLQLLDPQGKNTEGPLLSEMHGLGPAKQWGLDLAADLRAYVAGKLPWSACAKGLLLSGPPGTGKTSYARALSREAGVHFIATSYAAWQSHKDGHLGSVTAAIRKTFSEAEKNKPCIVFCDEIDTLPARGKSALHDDWWSAIVNTLLEQLDGFERREGVVVVAACNDPSRLDPALVRAGRLDHHIAIPLPDVPALVGIFRVHLGADLAGADLRAAALAARGHTGADVERWVRVARRTARAAGRPPALQDLLEAVRGGESEWPADVRCRIACHEAGHAIVQLALGVAEPRALSIGGAGGLAESDLGEMRAETRAHLEKFLVVLLGGRAAEQLTFAEVTAGAGGEAEGSDLARATRLATRLETDFGFGSLGLVCLAGDVGNRDLLMFDKLRTAVGSTIDRAYATALDVLSRNRRALDALAAALFAAGYLDRTEIEAVLARTPLCPQAVTDVPEVRLPKQPEARRDQTDTDVTDTPGDHRSQHIGDDIENLEPQVDRLQTVAPPIEK
jgi:cell division protease FtsH